MTRVLRLLTGSLAVLLKKLLMNPQLEKLQTILKLKFKDETKLTKSLTHRSFLNENKHQSLESNERYEFLGDAVLELWASQKLFALFPEFAEGQLTSLRSLIVCTENLAKIATNINLGQFILLSRGEETHGGRENLSILADTLESVIGAIYLDLGQKAVDKFLLTFLYPSMEIISKQKIFKDPKSVFQEIAQSKKGITPHYTTLSENGPDHQKVFEVGAYLGDELIAKGTGNSKQKAEESAAIEASKILT
jgi:ribonuclease-3